MNIHSGTRPNPDVTLADVGDTPGNTGGHNPFTPVPPVGPDPFVVEGWQNMEPPF